MISSFTIEPFVAAVGFEPDNERLGNASDIQFHHAAIIRLVVSVGFEPNKTTFAGLYDIQFHHVTV